MRAVCLGDPVIDLLGICDRDKLEALNIAEGGCTALDQNDFQDLLASLSGGIALRSTCGGSASNVAKGLANLMGAEGSAGFAGRVGSDEAGRDFERELREQQVQPLLCRAENEETAACLCLVTEGGQRTMRTHLAAASGLTSISQLPSEWLEGCKLLHLEGYVLYRPQLAREAMQAARRQGSLVSLDLSSFELVEHCQDILLQLLKEELVDIVACNEEEAEALSKVIPKDSTPSNGTCIQAAQSYILKFCKVSVVSLGGKGCILQGRGKELVHCRAPPAQVRDTVGAGDYFTAGFLYGYLHERPLETCGNIGCCVGSASVQHEGAVLSRAAWQNVRASMEQLTAS